MRTTRLGLFTLAALLVATLVSAQTATSVNKLKWDQLAQTSTVSGAAQYPTYPDAATVASAPVSSVTCLAAIAPLNPVTDSSCTGNVPAFTPGSHTLAITQSVAGLESAKSNTITFQFVVAVVPTQLRIVRGLGSFLRGTAFTSKGRQRLLKSVRPMDIKDFHRVG